MTVDLFGISLNSWMLLFIAWGLPLTYYRSRFRKMVYQTGHWSINFKPLSGLELCGLFGNLFPDHPEYLKKRNFYRFYLLVYFTLFAVYQI